MRQRFIKNAQKSKEALHNVQADTLKKAGFKTLDHCETIEETKINTNPYLKRDGSRDPIGRNNCTLTSVFGFLRSKGVDVKAGSTNGQPQNLAGIVEECFKVPRDNNGNTTKYIIEGTIKSFNASPESAADTIINRFGKDAEGVCSVTFTNGRGHAFSWKSVNGQVQFFDNQSPIDPKMLWSGLYGNVIDKNGYTVLARLDDLLPNSDGIHKWMYKG